MEKSKKISKPGEKFLLTEETIANFRKLEELEAEMEKLRLEEPDGGLLTDE